MMFRWCRLSPALINRPPPHPLPTWVDHSWGCSGFPSSTEGAVQEVGQSFYQSLLSSSSIGNKARIFIVSAPHAGSWVTAVSSVGLVLQLFPAKCHVAHRWWSGFDISGGSPCLLVDMVEMWLYSTTIYVTSLPIFVIVPVLSTVHINSHHACSGLGQRDASCLWCLNHLIPYLCYPEWV